MNINISRKISNISGRQIFDSRGVPTVEATVYLECGARASASVPSGVSTGSHEAFEKRDNEKAFGGRGVLSATDNISSVLCPALRGKDATKQYDIDTLMIDIDGSKNKSEIGANAILAVSLATAKAAACSYSLELFSYLGGINARLMPIPMMNILNGGAHASNNIDIQEFMIMPIGADSFSKAMQMGVEVYASLRDILKSSNSSILLGDEGGFAPCVDKDEDALELLIKAIEKAGYKPGDDISIALDIAASEWQFDNKYRLPKKKTVFTSDELADYYTRLIEKYPIISIEDPFGEEDWDSFNRFTEKHPDIQIVGDDLFVTNPERIIKGANEAAANAVLIKPNQIGTLSETLDSICVAAENSYNTVVSHRSGETPDHTIADIAVGTNSGQIKTGAPARGERISKYNRLLQIESLLGESAAYGSFRF